MEALATGKKTLTVGDRFEMKTEDDEKSLPVQLVAQTRT